MNKEAPKRLGRPKGSLNRPKDISLTPIPKALAAKGADCLIAIPAALAAKIRSLSLKTGVNTERIALGALVDGLRKWQGIHEILINYNESINALIQESGAGTTRKRTRQPAAAPLPEPTDSRDVVAMEDTLRLDQTSTAPRDNGPGNPGAGATHLSPDDDALLGRNPDQSSERVDQHFEQFIYGE